MHIDYYEKKFYPLQNKFIELMRDIDTPFYMTGGTVLSRFYLQHRYSDDLDFFVNWDNNFRDYVKQILLNIEKKLTYKLVLSSESFYRIVIVEKELELKIEFVNDVLYHSGKIVINKILGKIDSIENIFANKLSAIGDRCEAKDIADLWAILKKFR